MGMAPQYKLYARILEDSGIKKGFRLVDVCEGPFSYTEGGYHLVAKLLSKLDKYFYFSYHKHI
jgi:hypothetical protein